jgi:dienelactone hydrolase
LASIDDLAPERPLDAAFVLESVLAGAEPALSLHVDPDRIGALGHSYGGWTVLALNSLNRRPLATFAMAPLWGTRSPIPQIRRVWSHLHLDDWGRPVPTFLVAGERDALVILEDLRELSQILLPPKRFVVLMNAGHMHFVDHAAESHEWQRIAWSDPNWHDKEVDGPALAEASRPFSELCPAVPAMDAMRALCLAHMDAHVRDRAEAHDFLDGDFASAIKARGADLEVAAHH